MDRIFKHLTGENILALVNNPTTTKRDLCHDNVTFVFAGKINDIEAEVELRCELVLLDSGLTTDYTEITARTEPNEANYKQIDDDYEAAYYDDNEYRSTRLLISEFGHDFYEAIETKIESLLFGKRKVS